MDLIRLREVLANEIAAMSNSVTHTVIPALCEDLGLPIPDAAMTKRERLEWSAAQVSDLNLPHTARQMLVKCRPDAPTRNAIQDILWENESYPTIPKRARRELAQALDPTDLYLDPRRFDTLLDELWVLGNDHMAAILGRPRIGLRADIEQHIHINPGDWSVEFFFDRLGSYDASDRRFALFLEGLASADIRPDETVQRSFVGTANTILHTCGVELRETGNEGGYPVFTIVSLHSGNRGRPKNLIFASSVKPDLRFRDALDNDIEIVTNADKVLVYDRPIGPEGLKWRDMQEWWADISKIGDAGEAKATLYKRLLESLPSNSPPQKLLFKSFYKAFASEVPQLPALLPEVWLHWDPVAVKVRGAEALLRFRMDFLLLLPHNVRVVIEVDGKQHYADVNGNANVDRYADTMSADRDLKLSGYEVFRFGAVELQRSDAETKVKDFFESLFKRYGVRN